MYRETRKYFIEKAKLLFVVTGAEFIDTPCSINQFHFTGVERVRCMRNFQFNQRILIAIFPFYGFAAIDA
jgi:hypothetical protein